MTTRAKHWCFTLNNYTPEEYQKFVDFLSDDTHVIYGVVGKEVGESGTPHLQGYVSLRNRVTLRGIKALTSDRTHYGIKKRTPYEAAQYCKKDGDFVEFGTVPEKTQGKRSDWERLHSHIEELEDERPTRRSLFVLFPNLMARYEHAVWSYIDSVLPPVSFTDSVPRDGWQRDLADSLDNEPDGRSIEFVVDPIGNSGKTWFCQYLLQTRDDVQYLRPGRRDDMAHAVDTNKRIFLIDVPRGQMEYLQYSVLEMLKDRLIFSPKYFSVTKMIGHPTRVLVFCNEYPNPNALSVDRVSVTQLNYATVAG